MDCTVLNFSPSLQYLAFKFGVILDELINYINTCQVMLVVKNRPANAGDTGSIPDLGRSHMLQSNQACSRQTLTLCSSAGSLNC